jgi:exosome complex RNA-binding protein Csl4
LESQNGVPPDKGQLSWKAASWTQSHKLNIVYTQLVRIEEDKYYVRVAKAVEEACKLAEAGFDYTTIEGIQIFRK